MEQIEDIDFILHGAFDSDDENQKSQHKSSSWYFDDKKVILFALPGAFTPICTKEMLPSYEAYYNKFKKLGVDAIYCTAVNDDYVMEAWAKSLNIKKVEMLPDGNGELAESLGMLVKKTNLGFGNRSWRYAAYVVDGEIQQWWEEAGISHDCGIDPYEETMPDVVYEQLCEFLGKEPEEDTLEDLSILQE